MTRARAHTLASLIAISIIYITYVTSDPSPTPRRAGATVVASDRGTVGAAAPAIIVSAAVQSDYAEIPSQFQMLFEIPK